MIPRRLACVLALAAATPWFSARAGLPTTVLSPDAGTRPAAVSLKSAVGADSRSPARSTGDNAVTAAPPKPSTRAMLAGGGALWLLLRWMWRRRGRDSGIGL